MQKQQVTGGVPDASMKKYLERFSTSPELDRDTIPGGSEKDVKAVGSTLANLSQHRKKYCTNNGMLCYVDGNGSPWMLPYAQLTRKSEEMNNKTDFLQHATKALNQLGYKPGSFYVPHSNDGGRWGGEKAEEIVNDLEQTRDREDGVDRRPDEAAKINALLKPAHKRT